MYLHFALIWLGFLKNEIITNSKHQRIDLFYPKYRRFCYNFVMTFCHILILILWLYKDFQSYSNIDILTIYKALLSYSTIFLTESLFLFLMCIIIFLFGLSNQFILIRQFICKLIFIFGRGEGRSLATLKITRNELITKIFKMTLFGRVMSFIQ